MRCIVTTDVIGPFVRVRVRVHNNTGVKRMHCELKRDCIGPYVKVSSCRYSICFNLSRPHDTTTIYRTCDKAGTCEQIDLLELAEDLCNRLGSKSCSQ